MSSMGERRPLEQMTEQGHRMHRMKILVACEFSGVVRDAFRAIGHDAWSCDLLPTEADPAFHIQGDVLDHLGEFGDWEMLIAHPPCTYLANSGVRWLYGGRGKKVDPVRWEAMEAGARFFKKLWDAPIPHIVMENPIMHRFALERAAYGMKPDQIIQPWMFGHNETKATCLWLKNCTPLKPTKIVDGRVPRVHFASPGPDRWKERSRTLTGIAAAMAAQWGTRYTVPWSGEVVEMLHG